VTGYWQFEIGRFAISCRLAKSPTEK